MRFALSALITYLVSRLRSDDSLRLENIALRHQLFVYQRTVKRPSLRIRSTSHCANLAEEALPRLLATFESER